MPIRRTLLRRVPHIPLHFEARQEFDIAGSAVYVGFLVTLPFRVRSKLYPFRLKGVARLCLFVRAPFLLLLRAAFGLALPRDIESRRGVCDRGGVQESQNDDWQVNQHFPGILGQTRLLGGRFGCEPAARRMAAINAHR